MPDADLERADALLHQRLIQTLQAVHDTERRAHCAFGVIRIRLRGAEQRHDAVAEELFDHAAFRFDGRDHFGEELIQQAQQHGRVEALAQAGEAADVLEQDADVATLALQRHAAGEHCLRDIVRDEAAEGVADQLALFEPVDHFVERLGDEAELVVAARWASDTADCRAGLRACRRPALATAR